ncbi:threonine ammonia-lyase [Phaeodactylibacter luteus]|uniref:L-threonine dehydratase n=1 Tax=Phaeodactylibacter luteus TaxID=1564516 RepID=A0A5C6S3W3_9BACT|nr:threonine ammonia-lyase [Phaeodactylibacter luteus]TXB69538.1 threonine ammonia-lyase [Phaeodactylibacter luteus]
MPASVEKAPLASVESIYRAKVRLKGVAEPTPLTFNYNLSEQFGARVFLKREDMQVVRSYKIRGAYNKMATLDRASLSNGVVCASAGNHAQGFAFACQKMEVQGKVYMPSVTPKQKVKKVKSFGKEWVEVVLTGDTFDDAYREAVDDAKTNGKQFIHPFDDPRVIEGQGTVGLEILEDCNDALDYVFCAIGGGGLVSGLGSYFHQLSPNTKIIGVEPAGAPAMFESLKAGHPVTLEHIDSFVDGAAVRKVGDLTFKIAQTVLDDMILVPEGKVCSTILQLYNEEGIVVEPAGALTVAALDFYKEQIAGKNVVCILSGSNNDITRTEEIKERSLLYEGLKHYFIIRFPQRAGALRDFLNNVLGPNDDITHFEYTKKHNRDSGPALVGIQVQKWEDYDGLLQRMQASHIDYQTLNDSKMLFDLLV